MTVKRYAMAVRLKDDKSYPFIMIGLSKKWARIKKFRGKQNTNDILDDNINKIKGQIDEAESLKEEAKSNLANQEKKLADSKTEIQSMINLCLSNLEDINFFKPKEKKPVMLQNLRNIFYKMELSDKETRILSSVFGSLGKKR